MFNRIHFLLLIIISSLAVQAQQKDYLDEALKAEKWIHQNRIPKGMGIAWPVVPGDTIIETSLYSGTAGIVLFYLELYKATGNASYLTEAKSGADYLVSQFNKPVTFDNVGFYTGESGICYVLNKVYEISRDKKYADAAALSFKRLKATARISGSSADWRFNDIVYGGAGIGLMLLEMKNKQATDLAVQTGIGLIAQGIDAPGGKKWYMDTAMVRQKYYMPNFSHGTAGVSYFLARLYQDTGRKEFLQAALTGANHLLSIENKDSWIYHHDNEEGKNMFYLSWCHGPAGTSRLYYLLYQITHDEAWLKRIKTAAAAMMTCGIPEKQLPGFWNNVSACCGSASVAAFYLDLTKVFGDQMYLDFAQQMTQDLINRGTTDQGGTKWTQAEHRRRPELLQAQTGMMQGASGIGMWLLRLYEFQNHKKRAIVLPDNPF